MHAYVIHVKIQLHMQWMLCDLCQNLILNYSYLQSREIKWYADTGSTSSCIN